MAERIVDLLEAVEVEDHQCAARLCLGRVAERTAEIFGEVEPVRQAGQIVEARHAGNLLGRGALFGDVGADAAETQIFALVVEPRRSRQLPPARLAADRHRHDQVRKALAPLHTLRSEEHTSELQSLMRISYA